MPPFQPAPNGTIWSADFLRQLFSDLMAFKTLLFEFQNGAIFGNDSLDIFGHAAGHIHLNFKTDLDGGTVQTGEMLDDFSNQFVHLLAGRKR